MQDAGEDGEFVGFAAFFETGDLQLDHGEAEEQIGAEFAGVDLLAQRLVGGGHQSEIGAHRRGRAKACDGALFQHPQQLDLLIQRQIGDFIEEQRAAVGLLEVALVRGDRAGERALGMAEKKRLEQPVGNRAAVDHHERTLSVVRVALVQALGDALLAGAGFADDQYAVFAVGKGVDVVQQALHAFCDGDDVVGTLHLALRALQATQNAHQHGPQLGAGEVEGQHVRVFGRIASGGVAARIGADPQHRHAAKGAFNVLAGEAGAFQHRHAHDRDGIAGGGGGGRQVQAVGANHFHVHVEHATFDPFGNVGLTFPDVDDQIARIQWVVPRWFAFRFLCWLDVAFVRKPAARSCS